MSGLNGLTELQTAFPDAKVVVDGANSAVFLPTMKFFAGGIERSMNLLLHPAPHTSYDTRLFFEHRIDGCAANWTQHVVAGHSWWTPSFNGVPANLPLLKMLGTHLKAVA